jgi:hypothetical protein
MDNQQEFVIRWRGTKEGPLPIRIIEEKLARGEIGLLHEICNEGEWLTLRGFLARREAIARAERQAKEDHERKLREEAERRAVLQSAQQRPNASRQPETPANDRRAALLEKAVMMALKPRCPRWAWFCFGGCIVFWLLSTAWLDSANEERMTFIQTCDEISSEMKSASYQLEMTGQAILLSMLGEDPYRALEQPLSTLKSAKHEADRIMAKIQRARSATRFWLASSIVFLGIAVWRHLAYRRTSRSMGYSPPLIPSDTPPVA